MEKTMKAAVVREKGGDFEIIQIPIPIPEKKWVRIKVHATGICNTDSKLKNKRFRCTREPRMLLGHEVVGVIDLIGGGLENTSLRIGQKVGVGWFGGNLCHECRNCKSGCPNFCEKKLVTGVSFDGGFAEYMCAPYDALVPIPDGMNSCEAAPLLCAGVTCLSPIISNDIPKGSLVGVQGIGGLGHYATQYLNKMGYQVIAMSSSDLKEQLSRELGASHYVNMSETNWIEKMKEIGSVKCIIATAPNESIIQNLLESLGVNGKLIILSLMDNPIPITTDKLILGNKSIIGSLTGDTQDMYKTLVYSKNNNIKSMIQEIPLEEINNAINSLEKARFRYVIKFD